ncbi:hypothetical protein [Pseudomonas viridiflava]|uniref:hypothetical protein n=2 Tax=Pseudomonas viridiflava TaxID=33069 RepID=UPI000F01FA89|nr:hypothetical protein [Pseudomonas viridiflava]
MTDLIEEIKNKASKVADKAVDAFEVVTHDQEERTGVVAARISQSLAEGVDPDVLALQMTKNDLRNNPSDPVTFVGSDMPVIAKFHRANKRRASLTKAQNTQLIKNQRAADADGAVAQDGLLV